MNFSGVAGVCILSLVAALCMACEHSICMHPFPLSALQHIRCVPYKQPLFSGTALLSNSEHVKRQALPMLSSSFVLLQVIDQVVRTCPIDCRRPLYNNIVLSVSHLLLATVS